MNAGDLIRAARMALEPESFTLEDESAQHWGHAGAAGGGGHFRLTIVSPKFRNLSTLCPSSTGVRNHGRTDAARNCALSITALTPEEL